MMAEPETLMKQAGYTASEWLEQAIKEVKDLDIDLESKGQIISAYMIAAGLDELTMTIRGYLEK